MPHSHHEFTSRFISLVWTEGTVQIFQFEVESESYLIVSSYSNTLRAETKMIFTYKYNLLLYLLRNQEGAAKVRRPTHFMGLQYEIVQCKFALHSWWKQAFVKY